jgi:hypothetical protein
MLRIKTSLIMKMALALVSLPYNFSMPWSNSIGLINCFRIAKVTQKQGHDKKKNHW